MESDFFIDLNRAMINFDRAIWAPTPQEEKRAILEDWFFDVENLMNKGDITDFRDLQRVFIACETVMQAGYSIFFSRCFMLMGMSVQTMIRLKAAPLSRLEVLGLTGYEALKIQRRYVGDGHSSRGMLEVGKALMMLAGINRKKIYVKKAIKACMVGREYVQYAENKDIEYDLNDVITRCWKMM
ncbi:MAG: hypothetical protein ACMUHB_01780 [Thermoplasmatota archaeon]